MTAVGPFVAHDDGELGKRVDRSTGAHRRSLREGRESAAERDLSGRQRDRAALARDRAADMLDAKARERDALSDKLARIGGRTPVSSGRDVVVRAERDRQRATEDRACAAAERALAAENRAQAAADRLRSADDRQAALAEQQQLAHAVLGAVLGGVRSYDLIIRTGDANFVAAVRGAAIAEARTCGAAVQQALSGEGNAISVGCAEVASGDDASGLIDRAGAGRRSFGQESRAPLATELGARRC